MTKYFVMRECENIPTWISLCVTTVFSQQGGISIFKFPERFLVISCAEISLSWLHSLYELNLRFLRTHYQHPLVFVTMIIYEAQPMILTNIYPINIWAVMFIHAIAWMIALALYHKFGVPIHHKPLLVY